MKRILAALLPALSVAAATSAVAQQPAPTRPMPRAGAMAMAPAMARGGNPAQRLLALRAPLALTDAQVARLQQLATAQTQALIPQRPALLRARADLLEAIQKNDLDAAHGAMERIARLRTDAAFARLKAASDARGVLSADQRERLQQFQATRHARLGGFPRQRRTMPGDAMNGRPGGMGMPGMGDMSGMGDMRGPAAAPDSL